ncbi:NDP-hexose 2,3-dehydratase, partial [Streptomyces sp. SID7982]|nr:NDP-hexose 2,3-dehydratase [Streptomyces sp. SID7982]
MQTVKDSRVRPQLTDRLDPVLPERITRSAAARRGASVQDVTDWVRQRRREGDFTVRRIAFDDLEGWSFSPETG